MSERGFNDMSKNKMVIFKDYAEIVLCNKYGMESGRVKIDVANIELIEPHRWAYNLRSGASSTIDGKHIGINRYITNAKVDELVFWLNGDRFDCRRCNLEIHKIKSDSRKQE